jgi:hypothetical protein
LIEDIMEIKPYSNIDSLSRVAVRQVGGSAPKPGADSADFEAAAELREALQQTSDIRPEAVNLAKILVGDVTYPPLETIQRIGALLAIHISKSSDSPDS